MTDTAANQSGNAGIFTADAAATGTTTATTITAPATAPVATPAPTEAAAPVAPVQETAAPDSAAAQLASMTPEEKSKAELDSLKKKATLLGLTFSNNIGTEALRAKIQEKLSGDAKAAEEAAPTAETQVNALDTAPVQEAPAATADTEAEPEVVEAEPSKPLNKRQQMLAEQMRLVRCHIVNLDPKKKDLPGEIISVANERLGNVRKFIPFGEVTENGYHIPYVIYKMLERRKFLQIRTRRDPRTGTNITTQAWVREFAIRILDPLTKEQLHDLAVAQTAAGSIDSNG